MLTKVGDCEGYLDMTSTRLSTPSTSGTASKCSTRWKLPRRRCKCNALCVLVPGQGLCQRARQALISPPHPPPVQGLSQFWAKFPDITPLFFYSTNYSTSSRAGRAIYWSNYKIINNSNGPEMMTLSSGTREGELPLISISERALATKVRQQLHFSSNYESTPMFHCRMAMAGERREKRCAARLSQSRSPSRTSSRSPPSSPSRTSS